VICEVAAGCGTAIGPVSSKQVTKFRLNVFKLATTKKEKPKIEVHEHRDSGKRMLIVAGALSWAINTGETGTTE